MVSNVLTEVLKKIKPNQKEREEMNEFCNKILNVSQKISKTFSANPMICGSAAKDTWLSNKNEIDLFLLFNPILPRKKLEEHGMAVAKEIVSQMNGKYEIAYAEHPYLRAFIGKYEIDIVPCYNVKDPKKIKSAVDRTPYHVRYVKKNLKLPDEARILKQFCMGTGCYGADVKTLGFSGYLCELLIIEYGKFINLIREAANWRAGIVINGRKDLLKKFKNPLVFIDPVDPKRNVAAAVSIENFYKFVSSCKNFLRKPEIKFFLLEKVKPYSIHEIVKEIKRRGTRWYLIKFKRPDIIDDTLYPQMRRCLNAIEKIMIENGFKVLRKDCYADDKICIFAFEMEIWLVPRIIKNIGPNVYSRHAEEFLKHYSEDKVFIENENWIVEKQRDFITVLHLLDDLISKSENNLKLKGIPSKIVSNLKKSEIYAGGYVLKLIGNLPEEFRIFIREWFEKDLNLF